MSSPASVADTTLPEIAHSQFDMSRANRLAFRNVHIYDAKHRDTVLGGFFLAQELTNLSVYAMLDIFITCAPSESISLQNNVDNFFLRMENGEKVGKDNNLFKEGTYYLDATCEIPYHLF